MFHEARKINGLSVGWYSHAGADALGGKTNEDAVAVLEKRGVFGVFDGNGKSKQVILKSMNLSPEDWTWARQKLGVGYDISDQFDPAELSIYLREHMPSAFFDEMISDADNLEYRLRNLFGMFHNKVRDRCMMGSASTALLVFIDETGERLTVANCGDSRAVLCRMGQSLQLTRDQKNDLNVGAEGFDQRQVTIDQERLDKTRDTFLLLMSDGVYNAFEGGNDEVVAIIEEQMNEGFTLDKIARHVVDRARRNEEEGLGALQEESGHRKIDDMTLVLVSLGDTLHLTPIEITEGRGATCTCGGLFRSRASLTSPTPTTVSVSLMIAGLFVALCLAVIFFLFFRRSG